MIEPRYNRPELDDRREIFNLLERLTPAMRIEWLRWCCFQANGGSHLGVQVIRSTGFAVEVFFDFTTIIGHGLLTLEMAGGMLVLMARGIFPGEVTPGFRIASALAAR